MCDGFVLDERSIEQRGGCRDGGFIANERFSLAGQPTRRPGILSSWRPKLVKRFVQ
jgi:hypothetical protein